MLVYPPRVINSPTGTILPSMVLHLSAGGSFGLSDKEGNGGFLISFGLGGVGEAMVSSSRILHISGSKTNALAGFRVKLPVGLLGPRVSKQLALALNVAASNEIDYFASGDYVSAPDDGPVEHVETIDYTHRETTLGIAATWTQGKTRLHAALHGTDLRTENISYWTQESAYHTGPDQRDTYTTVGLGFDYAANERTQLLAEVRTVPRIVLNAGDGDLRVEQITVYATGTALLPAAALRTRRDAGRRRRGGRARRPRHRLRAPPDLRTAQDGSGADRGREEVAITRARPWRLPPGLRGC